MTFIYYINNIIQCVRLFKIILNVMLTGKGIVKS